MGIESLSSGTPICGFNGTGVEEQVSKGGGFTVDNGDINLLLSTLKAELSEKINLERRKKLKPL